MLVLLLSVRGLEVVSSFVNRDLVTALSKKDVSRFFQLLLAFFGVVLVAITPIAAFYGYVEDKLGLYWRRWLTNHFLEQYFRQRASYEINANPQIENPDQRLAEDVMTYWVYKACDRALTPRELVKALRKQAGLEVSWVDIQPVTALETL